MLVASEKKQSSFEPVEAGMHIGVCSGIIDLGEQRSVWKEQERISRKVMVMWELPDETYKDEEGYEHPRTVTKRYTMSLNQKSALYEMLVAWRGKPFAASELAGFDLRNMVGEGCQLSIVHDKVGDKVYANINAVVGMPKGLAAPVPSTTYVFDLDAPDAIDTINILPSWVQDIIRNSETWKAMNEAADKPCWEAPATDENAVGDDDLPF